MTSPQHEKTKDKKRGSRSFTIAFYTNTNLPKSRQPLEAAKG
jgi:hypothetical protein